MDNLRAVAVFCGSRAGARPAYAAAAATLGRALAERGVHLVYGGGGIGLMGVLAQATLAAGGHVVGVVPEFLMKLEVARRDVSELVLVDSMHARKAEMFARSDAAVVLPGGIGTLDEAIEIITWKQLRLHDRPIVLVDVEGCWKPLLALIDGVIAEGFAHPAIRGLYSVVDRVEDVFAAIAAAPPADPRVLTSHL